MTTAPTTSTALAAALFAAVGCASTTPATERGVEPERAPESVVREQPRQPATSPVRARFEYAPGTVSYLVTSEATIAEIDSVAAPRVFREVAHVEITIVPVDGYTVATTSGSVESDANASVIAAFVDTLRVASVDSIAEPRLPICGRDTVPPVHLVTLLPPVPQELQEGQQWRRRHIYGTCQGSVPVRVERTDSYVVTGGAPQVPVTGVTLTRSSSFAYSGSGVEGQHNVRITGSGSGQATLILNVPAGRLVGAEEESISEIDVTASGRTRRFSQRVVRRVEER